MNICFLIGNLSIGGGAERVTSLIANELAKEKNNAIHLLSIFGGDSFYKIEANVRQHKLYTKKPNLKLALPISIIKLRRYLIKNKIDVLIATDMLLYFYTYPAMIGLKTKIIFWEHSSLFFNIGNPLRDLARKWACQTSDALITLTEKDKIAHLEKFKIKGEIINIYNPSAFETISTSKTDQKTVLAIGRLTDVKGFDHLLHIWQIIEKTRTDWRLHLVGSGEDETKLKTLATELNLKNLVFFPATQQVEKHYQNASILVMSSKFEGLPLVLIEGQTYGLPIVAFDCKFGPAEVISDQINGYLIPENNIDLFAEKLLNLMQSKEKREKMSTEAKNASKRFEMKNIIPLWLDLLKKINTN